MSVTHYLGFHGSDLSGAALICGTNKFHISNDDEEWLGDGIYFFENDIRQAEFWCTTVKKYPEWGVVKSDIEAEIVLDLLLIDHLERFHQVAKTFSNRYYKRRDGIVRKKIDAAVLNAMYKMQPYDLVRGIFNATYIKIKTDRSNITPMQIQLCVRNKDCIKTITRAR